MTWYRIVLQCGGVPPDVGATAAADITEDFWQRTWHRNVLCRWDGARLTLTTENDFDRDGHATSDEFSDAISACIKGGFDGDISIVSVDVICA